MSCTFITCTDLPVTDNILYNHQFYCRLFFEPRLVLTSQGGKSTKMISAIIRSITSVIHLMWTLVMTTLKCGWKIIWMPFKVLQTILSVLMLPFYLLAQILSIVTNIMYLVMIVYILRALFGYQSPDAPGIGSTLMNWFHWLMPGYVFPSHWMNNPSYPDMYANHRNNHNQDQFGDMFKRYNYKH